MHWKIYYQNVRGLKSKLDSLQEMINNYQPSLKVTSSTKLFFAIK